MTDDQRKVVARYPDAGVVAHCHGKIRIESHDEILSEMMYLGTRERRVADAWANAAFLLLKEGTL